MGQIRPTRKFWWDRKPPVDADALRAVIFDADSALADIERDGHRVAFNAALAERRADVSWSVEEHTKTAVSGDCVLNGDLDDDLEPRAGLIDLVMSLFVAGIWVGVVSTRRRAWVETLVRQLVGDGLVETIVTVDDLPEVDLPGRDAELYRLALWELGITPHDALAVAGSGRGLRAAVTAELPALVVTTGYTADQQFIGAAAVRAGYDGPDPLLAAGCQHLHRRWWVQQQRCGVA
jgi:phosphoglycolate phosphatase-like HAD superfamily hydrolase